MNDYAITNGLIDSVIRDFIIIQLHFAAKVCLPKEYQKIPRCQEGSFKLFRWIRFPD